MSELFSDYSISTDIKKLQIAVIHHYLSVESYWAKHIPLEIVKQSIDNSLCFGVYFKNEQVGFARVVTDYATFGYLADVFILETHRRKGLSKWLMEYIMVHPKLQGLRRFSLATRDAHSLYAQFGFKPLSKPESIMEIKHDNFYTPQN
ncbi:MAG TPA: GNAT family N-acetyltransferase [Bacteroidia bacterium]|nr:GNAT family N-acetyltransferase [Bacteroidia bacterium]